MDENTTYIVSGIMRSGSSMMMKALVDGGMDVFYDPERDNSNSDSEYKGETYVVNPGGFYELNPEFYEPDKLEELSNKARGKLIKFLIPGLMKFPITDDVHLKIIVMLRNPEEIAKSWEIAFKGLTPELLGFDLRFYGFMMRDAIKFFEEEMNAEVLVVSYHSVLKNPKKEFRLIRDDGWPIQPTQSAKTVDTSLHRIKKDNLAGDKRVQELWTPGKK